MENPPCVCLEQLERRHGHEDADPGTVASAARLAIQDLAIEC